MRMAAAGREKVVRQKGNSHDFSLRRLDEIELGHVGKVDGGGVVDGL